MCVCEIGCRGLRFGTRDIKNSKGLGSARGESTHFEQEGKNREWKKGVAP